MLEHLRYMAAYNIWQNESLYAAADGLQEEQRREDCGLFFHSIHKTLNHILWADQLWMNRFAATPAPSALDIPSSMVQYSNWSDLCSTRNQFDQLILVWAQALVQSDLDGSLSWHSGALGRMVSKPRKLLMAHMFNHQTHHRGQVHGALSRFGATLADTDMPFMPGAYFPD